MRKFRFVYWFCSMKTERIIKAHDLVSAKHKFFVLCGSDTHIFSIEEVTE